MNKFLCSMCVLLAVSLSACSKSEPEKAAESTAPAEASEQKQSQAQQENLKDLTVIPPAQGSWEEMWEPLKSAQKLFLPATGLDAVVKDVRAGKKVDLSQYALKYYYHEPVGKGKGYYLTLYSDEALIQDKVQFLTDAPALILQRALFDSISKGVSFNFPTRPEHRQVFSFHVDKFYLAQLIGYLLAKPDDGSKPFWELAEQAQKDNRPYEACYYATRSYFGAKEPLEKSHLIKLWSWVRMGFPSALVSAQRELNWYVQKYGASEQTEALKQQILELAEKLKQLQAQRQAAAAVNPSNAPN